MKQFVLLLIFWNLFTKLAASSGNRKLIEESTIETNLQNSFDLLTDILIKVQALTALAKFLAQDSRGDFVINKLTQLTRILETLEESLMSSRLLDPFCGHWSLNKDKMMDDLVNAFQVSTRNPWIKVARNSSIRAPILENRLAHIERRRILHEALLQGKLEFKTQNRFRRKDGIRTSLVKYARPAFKEMILKYLKERFGVSIKNISSIPDTFETDMPAASNVFREVCPLYEIYAKYPDYTFKLKETAR